MLNPSSRCSGIQTGTAASDFLGQSGTPHPRAARRTTPVSKPSVYSVETAAASTAAPAASSLRGTGAAAVPFPVEKPDSEAAPSVAWSSLFDAVVHNDAAACKSLLDELERPGRHRAAELNRVATIDHPDRPPMLEGGVTLLTAAAWFGHAELVALLLAAGAQPDLATASRGAFALICAARNGHAAALQALLDGGASVDKRTVPEHLSFKRESPVVPTHAASETDELAASSRGK